MTETDLLLQEVRTARAKYHDLEEQCYSLSHDMLDAVSSDGTLASAQFARKHREALEAFNAYSVALKRFTRAVLHGEYPDYPSGSGGRGGAPGLNSGL